MKDERLTKLRIQHNDPKNWYSKVCRKCKKKYAINRITTPEVDEDLNYCFSCFQKHVIDYMW